MIGYLILLLELAVLAWIFWYFWMRKTPTYQVEGDPWGEYSKARKCESKIAKLQLRRGLNLLNAGRIKQKRPPVRIKQSRKHGWVFSEKEQAALRNIAGVNLETTNPNLRKKQQDRG